MVLGRTKKNTKSLWMVIPALLLAFMVLGSCEGKKPSPASLSNAGWEKALDEYEQFVDEYVAFMKKYTANPGDLTMLTQYASMLQKAERAADAISQVEDDLSGDDLVRFTERYTKLLTKMATALQ